MAETSWITGLALLGALGWAAAATLRCRGTRRQVAALEERQRQQQAAIDRLTGAQSRTEAGYLAALQGSLDGMWDWQPGNARVSLSPRWKGMLGFGPDELADEPAAWWARVHEGDRALLQAELQRHAAARTPRFELEQRLLHRDGTVRHVLTRAVVVDSSQGDAPGELRIIGLDTDVTRLKRVQSVLDAVADGTAGTRGERFFAAMVQHFARALEVDCAFVTECADEPATRMRTLAFWTRDNGLRENFEYVLAGTPCEAVVQGAQTCFHRDALAERFPREAGWEAYLGMPIVASDGRMLGHLALLHRRPLGDEVLVDRVYRIFLARAAAEIERLQALMLVREQNVKPA